MVKLEPELTVTVTEDDVLLPFIVPFEPTTIHLYALMPGGAEYTYW